jgi:hypothetical protein
LLRAWNVSPAIAGIMDSPRINANATLMTVFMVDLLSEGGLNLRTVPVDDGSCVSSTTAVTAATYCYCCYLLWTVKLTTFPGRCRISITLRWRGDVGSVFTWVRM